MLAEPHVLALQGANPALVDYDGTVIRFETAQEAMTFALWVALNPLGDTKLSLPVDADNSVPLEPSEVAGEPSFSLEPSDISCRTHVMIRTSHKESYLDTGYGDHYGSIIARGLRPEQVILWLLHPGGKVVSEWRSPWDHECFWEYLAGCYLRSLGYVVTRWHPSMGAYGGQAPDVCAYHMPELSEALRATGIGTGGCFEVELGLLPAFGHVWRGASPSNGARHGRTVVVEAKSRDRVVRGQIEGYLQSGYFEAGFMSLPDHPEDYDRPAGQTEPLVPDAPYRFGLISNRPDGRLAVKRSQGHGEVEEVASALDQFSAHLKVEFAVHNFSVGRLLSLMGVTDLYLREIGARIREVGWAALLEGASRSQT